MLYTWFDNYMFSQSYNLCIYRVDKIFLNLIRGFHLLLSVMRLFRDVDSYISLPPTNLYWLQHSLDYALTVLSNCGVGKEHEPLALNNNTCLARNIIFN
jgi:hypothetical protein